ncbi:MAG TPA: cysteine desulfurase family protein, partial [Thermoanaerobaculia bacterium]|nr:cysteine desulfurase family protein [Thermoanaerobaculia bacterium]
MSDLVYLDHNATTPLDPRVREAMLPWLGERFGNPSSIHRVGQAARNAVEEAREHVAALIGARPPEVVFTASGTEANDTVVASAVESARRSAAGGGHLAISAVEHPSVRQAAARAAQAGLEVTRVPPGEDGVVPAAAMIGAMRPDTLLACLMLANNEVGTLQPVAAVAAECRARGIPLLCDAVQAVGKVPVDVGSLGVDLLALGAHKFGGPLGAAALWIRDGVEVESLLVGGSQERRRRAGTENVAAIVGLGAAAALARDEVDGQLRPPRPLQLAALRDRFEAGLRAVPGAIVHCRTAPRLPNTSHVAFTGVEGEALLIRLDLAGFAVSTGSACSSGTVEPSQTLLAMGLSPAEALSSIRVSFGTSNHAAEVDRFLAALAGEVAALRRLTGS